MSTIEKEILIIRVQKSNYLKLDWGTMMEADFLSAF